MTYYNTIFGTYNRPLYNKDTYHSVCNLPMDQTTKIAFINLLFTVLLTDHFPLSPLKMYDRLKAYIYICILIERIYFSAY